ncbi:MAG TPA: MCE family protein [Aeromicrobium sp.]|nr:MCE family protein [Aeromicrobium sp.]
MLVNIVHDTPREHRRLFVAGIAFVSALAILVAISIAIYDKTFTSKTTVTVMADRAGTQLARFGDVRMHGALVGYVDNVSSDGQHAKIRVALKPEAARGIPSDVSAQILPTTLFGQNYIEFFPVKGGSAASPLRDGSVIPASRVTTNVALQRILADLYPVLRAINPADVNATLYALSHALQGKGEDIGETLEALSNYLETMNGELPRLKTDLRLFADVARTYEKASPDLIDTLENVTVTSRTIKKSDDDLEEALSGLTGLAKITRKTLTENKKLIRAQVRSANPLLKLLATYSPEFPCSFEGLALQIPDTANVFQTARIHQTLELGTPQRTAYTAEDAPVYGEVGHGPWCLGLPRNAERPAPFQPLKDGTDKDEPDGGMG